MFKKDKKLGKGKIVKKNREGKNMIELKAVQKFYFITFNESDNSLKHYGSVDAGNILTTGQPAMEEYDNEAEYLARLTELGLELQQ